MSDFYMVQQNVLACIRRNLTTSERLHIYRKTCAFLKRWRKFLSREHTKIVTTHDLADNNNIECLS